MNQRKIFIVLLFSLLISCEKNSNSDEIMISDKITLGDYSLMMVNAYDTILSDLGMTVLESEIDFDIDRDNINDIGLRIVYVHGFAGWRSYWFSEISSLHENAFILGFLKTDTIYLNRLTYIQSTSNGTQISEYYNHICFRKDPTDSILKIVTDDFKIFPKDKGGIISNSEVFKSGTIRLIQSEESYTYTDPINDTLFIINTVNNNDCHSFPQGEIKYIGIKLTQGTNEKLGWIKIIVMDIHKIIIFESAIHE